MPFCGELGRHDRHVDAACALGLLKIVRILESKAIFKRE